MIDNRGKRPAPIRMCDALAAHSSYSNAMKCSSCVYFSSGWCSLKASHANRNANACEYGYRKTVSMKSNMKGKTKNED